MKVSLIVIIPLAIVISVGGGYFLFKYIKQTNYQTTMFCMSQDNYSSGAPTKEYVRRKQKKCGTWKNYKGPYAEEKTK